MRRLSFSSNARDLTDQQVIAKSVLKALADMKFIDVQAACIVRGMDFDDLAESDAGGLETYLLRNWENKQERNLLEEYDIWVNQMLSEKYDADDPILKFKKFSIWSEEGEVKVNTKKLRRAKIPKKKKEKVKRNATFNIVAGTKKEYTHQLAESLFAKFGKKYENKALMKKFSNKLVDKVRGRFEDVNEKSVKIWMKKALNALSDT